MTAAGGARSIRVTLESRPGRLAAFGRILGEAGVSLEGGGVCTHREEAVANFLVDDADLARRALEAHGIGPVSIDDVVAVRLDQETPGQLGAFASVLADAGIDIVTQYSDHDHRLVVVVAPDDHAACARVAAEWTASRAAAPRGARPWAPTSRTHVLYEGEAGTLVSTGDVTIEGVSLPGLVDAAVVASATADRIELCGGIDVADAARVLDAVGVAVDVRVNRYGFESLEQVAAYSRAFADGDGADAAFLYAASASTPIAQHAGVLVAGVADAEALADASRAMRDRGVGIIELYGGLGAAGAAIVRAAVDGSLPVGFVD